MKHSSIRAYLTPRLGIMLPLGFASGLPLALTGGTLQAWLTEAGLDLTTIGLFAYVGLPCPRRPAGGRAAFRPEGLPAHYGLQPDGLYRLS